LESDPPDRTERLQHDPSVSVQPRRSDRGLSGLRKRTHHLTSGFETVWRARTANTLVVCNAAIEILVIATLRPILARHLNLVAVDFLLPAPAVSKRLLLRLLSRFDRVFCIRSGDMAALHRWCGVPIERLAFIPFPANESLLDLDTTDDSYVYAGSAHSDWSVLMEALEHLAPDTPQITISTSDHLTIPRAVVDRRRLAQGRARVGRARSGARHSRTAGRWATAAVDPHGTAASAAASVESVDQSSTTTQRQSVWV